VSELSEPRIVCAAVLLKDGLIVSSARHFDRRMRLTLGRIDRNQTLLVAGAEQGFIDQYGDFYTRGEAWTIAHKQGQIRRDLPCGVGVLYSEHLY